MVRWAAWRSVRGWFPRVGRAGTEAPLWGVGGVVALALALGACSLGAPAEDDLFPAGSRRDAGRIDAGASGMDATTPFSADEGLVLHYRFNESTGKVVHDFAGEGDGIIYGDEHWVAKGRIEGALQLSGAGPGDGGAGNYVELPPGVLSELSECTISTWFSWAGNHSWERVFDFGNGLPVWIYFTPSDAMGQARVAGRLADPKGVFLELVISRPVRTSTWTHLAIAWTTKRVRVYLDGELAGEAAPEAGVVAQDLGYTMRNWIGRSQFQPGEHPQGFVDPDFGGMIDDFRIYDHALSASDVAQLYSLE